MSWNVQICKNYHTVLVAHQKIELSPKEFDVLLYLMEHPK
jgi:DNA-binding response OmpR family regulator